MLNVHLYTSPIEFESRIERITSFLAREARFDEIHIVGTRSSHLPPEQQLDNVRRIVRVGPPPLESVPGIGSPSRLANWMRAVWALYKTRDIASVNPHNVTTLPIAALLARRTGAKLVYDPHELETETAVQRGIRKPVFASLERWLMPRVDETIVVTDAINEWYRKAYRTDRVTTVRNVPVTLRSEPRSGPGIRERFGIKPGERVAIYQGLFTRGRVISLALQAFEQPIADWHLVFMGDGAMRHEIEAAARERPWIHIHPLVPSLQVQAYTSDADLGLAVAENVSLSYYYSLPNKFFEYLHAGVPAVMSDFPEMRKVIDESGAGWTISPQANELRALIERLTDDDLSRARARMLASRDAYTWERESQKLREPYGRLGLLR